MPEFFLIFLMLHRSLCQQVVIELYYAVAEG